MAEAIQSIAIQIIFLQNPIAASLTVSRLFIMRKCDSMIFDGQNDSDSKSFRLLDVLKSINSARPATERRRKINRSLQTHNRHPAKL